MNLIQHSKLSLPLLPLMFATNAPIKLVYSVLRLINSKADHFASLFTKESKSHRSCLRGEIHFGRTKAGLFLAVVQKGCTNR